MAAAITAATGRDVALIEGSKGVFEVRVDGRVVCAKTMGHMPEPSVVISAVEEALS